MNSLVMCRKPKMWVLQGVRHTSSWDRQTPSDLTFRNNWGHCVSQSSFESELFWEGCVTKWCPTSYVISAAPGSSSSSAIVIDLIMLWRNRPIAMVVEPAFPTPFNQLTSPECCVATSSRRWTSHIWKSRQSGFFQFGIEGSSTHLTN